MGIDFGWQNRTVVGYHSKDNNTFGIIDKSYPILTRESDALFLLTRDNFFTISTPQISNVTGNYLRYKNFNDTVRLIANIFLVPGLIIAIGYMLRTASILNNFPSIEEFLSSNISNTLFGISMLSVIVLWFDYYKDKSHPVRLPFAEKIPRRDLDELQNADFKFGRYGHLETINFVNEDSLELICTHTKNDSVNTYMIFRELLQYPEIVEIFQRANIDIDEEILKNNNIVESTLPTYPSTALRSIFIYSLNESLLTKSLDIRPEHILISFFEVFPVLKKFLQVNNSSVDILREVVRYQAYERRIASQSRYFNPYLPYYRKGGIAEKWIYGYTFILSHFSKNLNETISEDDDIYGIGHEEEIDSLVSVLGKISNKNALLIGEPGVGKSSLILGVAQRINKGNVPEQIKDKRIIQLDINGLIAYSSREANIEELIQKAMTEINNSGDVILYIDEMQELMPAKAKDSGHSLAGILMPYILDSKFPIIGTVNYSDYKKYFYTNESLRQTFTNIEVKEISADDALQILETKVRRLEKNFGIFITFPALISTTSLAQRYIKDKKLPSSSVQLIEAASSWAQANGIAVLTADHISKVVSIQKGIAVSTVDPQESTKLMKLEENIKSKVIGQDEAVIAVSEALRRAHTDIRNPNKPIGTFLFMGPTGVGKTHLAKMVAEEYFGDSNDIILVDMSEYQDVKSIDKFLGQSESINSQSSVSLVDRIKQNPYTVVLFDEIEKANPQVLNLFLQIFDEGRLTSNMGEVVDFTNSIIVCTSNIGSSILLDSLSSSDTTWDTAKDKVLIELRQYLKPELINRFDKIIVFKPHTLENLANISEIILRDLAKRISEKGITLTWNDVIPKLIANKANEPGMGARPIKRYIQDNIEGQIAKEMIEQAIQSGDEIEIKEAWLK